jgi:hypothetical protein
MKKKRTVSARKLAMLRRATTDASNRYSISGTEKKAAPKPVTLPKLRFLEKADKAED